MPDVNAFNVLIKILCRDIGKIHSFSHGENLVAFVMAAKKDSDYRDNIKLITFELCSFSIFIVKSPAMKNSFAVQKIGVVIETF